MSKLESLSGNTIKYTDISITGNLKLLCRSSGISSSWVELIMNNTDFIWSSSVLVGVFKDQLNDSFAYHMGIFSKSLVYAYFHFEEM